MATRTIASEMERRRRQGGAREKLTMLDDLLVPLRTMAEQATRVRFPSPRYQQDPVAFAREILGVEPWSKQVEILEGIRDHTRVAVKSGHKVSKLLALDTPVPTPSGWTTVGEIRPGDVVFDERGEQCNVLGLSDIENGTECFEVEFDDGTVIVTDATHAWKTWTHRARKACDRRGDPRVGPGEMATTSEIRRTLRTKHAGRNHAVVTAKPVKCAEKSLPIDPYVLGVWLGDGTSACGSYSKPDEFVADEIRRRGFVVTDYADGKGHGVLGLMTKLREQGLLCNKHVPDAYMRASESQRRDLLAGLLDTDGTCNSKNGRVSFTNMNKAIALAVFELAASLGYKPHWREDRATLNGVDHGPCYEASFVAHDPVFKLPRKLARQHSGKTKQQWTRQRMIVDVRPTSSVPVRCIEVDSPSHLFLVTRSFIPTHNSHSAAIIALWFFCSYPDARVVMTSTTARQVDQILWRELRMMRARSGRCCACKGEDPDGHRIPRPCPHSALIEGEMGELARTGIKTPDFREVVGFTAREAEAVAGISGRNLLYIADEASGIPEEIFEAIEGNRAGGARIVMFSNPTRTSGEFYEAFTSKKEFYHGITISSEDTPNCREGRLVIPGLATREWVDEKALEWGRESPMFKVRILGEFALAEDGRIFSIHAIEQAEQRWFDAPEAGRLFIGVDPAGPSGSGDETVFCARRGLKALHLRAHRGLNAEAHLVHLLGQISALKLPRETPVVVLDREGSVGAELFGMLRGHVEANPASFELVGVRASDRAVRQPHIYDRLRDELTANLESWFRDGGSIPEDAKLSAELHALEWKQQANGRLKVTPKDVLRKQLGRSPDRYDALALAAWEPLALREDVHVSQAARTAATDSFDYGRGALDPYAGADAWGRR